ncbi:DUF229 domain-containing protein [Euzebyella marina]|uniref:DUF229 domain-containing protein n=1 Tax=Euzebyella marina TaxID=1761453 RepID=A0A3G2L2A9_9FLAO|nr:sulfatase [Euzebyella marina]AYN66417.1 DUF229 domain-containing protein [Euzebyella marina]
MKFFLLSVFISFSVFLHSQENSRPNILVIIFDDAGLDMSAYGSTYVNTPGFDAIAKNGVLFNRAYTPNAKCAPSRASLMTGRNSWQLDAAANHVIYFPPKFKTYQEVLQENGYTIGFTGKGYAPAITLTADGKEREVLGPAYNTEILEPLTSGISSNDYSANFDNFLQRAPKDAPWSFWVGSLEPHRGYEYGSGKRIGGKTEDMIKDFPPYWPDNEVTRTDLLDYALEIENFDEHIVKIMNSLERSGQLNNTLVVVTSDHGMPFPRVKGDQYENANHVPMAIQWPKAMNKKNRKVEDYISFIDLAPTFLEAAGIDWQTSGMHPPAGKSLLNILGSSKSGQIDDWRNFVLVGKERHDTGRPRDVGYPIRGIHKNNMLYIKNYEIDRWPKGNPETGYLNTDGSPTKTEILKLRRNGNSRYWRLNFGKRVEEELYDLNDDPFCMNNLASDLSYADEKSDLRFEMEMKLKEQDDLRMQGYGHLYEQAPFVNGRDFYHDFMAGKQPKAGWVNDSDFEPFVLDGDGNELEPVKINLKN